MIIVSKDFGVVAIINNINKSNKEIIKTILLLLFYFIIKDINKDFSILERNYKVYKNNYNLYYKLFNKVYF